MSNGAPQEDNGIPRGALIVVAVGLLACLAAAALATGKGEGESARLEWIERAVVPDSRPVAVPGGDGKQMQLIRGSIVASGVNAGGYELFRVASTLRVDAGSPLEEATIVCAIKAGPRTEIARSAEGLRALYPRSSESGIFSQNMPEALVMDFSARGGENVIVEADDLRILGFTTEQGVKLEWPKYLEGTERLEYFIAGGTPSADLDLPFFSIWKASAAPRAKISCTVKNSAGEATTTTVASLPKLSPPIDEEAEDEAEEQADEEADELEEDEAEGDE